MLLLSERLLRLNKSKGNKVQKTSFEKVEPRGIPADKSYDSMDLKSSHSPIYSNIQRKFPQNIPNKYSIPQSSSFENTNTMNLMKPEIPTYAENFVQPDTYPETLINPQNLNFQNIPQSLSSIPKIPQSHKNIPENPQKDLFDLDNLQLSNPPSAILLGPKEATFNPHTDSSPQYHPPSLKIDDLKTTEKPSHIPPYQPQVHKVQKVQEIPSEIHQNLQDSLNKITILEEEIQKLNEENTNLKEENSKITKETEEIIGKLHKDNGDLQEEVRKLGKNQGIFLDTDKRNQELEEVVKGLKKEVEVNRQEYEKEIDEVNGFNERELRQLKDKIQQLENELDDKDDLIGKR